jgi:hypothetical protein
MFESKRARRSLALAELAAFDRGRYASKLGLNQEVLEKTLWGEFYFNLKEKKITKKPVGNMKPMFVAFVLENIWQVLPRSATPPDMRTSHSMLAARRRALRGSVGAGLQRSLESARRSRARSAAAGSLECIG